MEKYKATSNKINEEIEKIEKTLEELEGLEEDLGAEEEIADLSYPEENIQASGFSTQNNDTRKQEPKTLKDSASNKNKSTSNDKSNNKKTNTPNNIGKINNNTKSSKIASKPKSSNNRMNGVLGNKSHTNFLKNDGLKSLNPFSKLMDFTKNSKLFSGSGNIVKSLWSKIPFALKIKIIAACGAGFLLLIMAYAVFAQDDIQNLSLTNGSSISGKNSGRRNCSETEIEDKLLYVGDSRTVGMESAVANSNISYIAKVAEGYNWFNNTALADIDTKLQDKSDSIIVLALGINDLHNIDNYITAYKSLMTKYPNNNIYVLSVNPVDESKTGANGYSVTNAQIEAFNKKLVANFPNNYIDSYSSLTNIGSSDGIHYDNTTYTALNSIITSNIKSSGKVKCGGGSFTDIPATSLNGGGAVLMKKNQSLLSLLGQAKLDDWNSRLKNDVIAAGIGTNDAMATVAFDLIQGALDENLIVPYFWGGGHGVIHDAINGNWGGYATVGASGNRLQPSGSKQPNGLDCSGFVSWVLYNGGCTNFVSLLADDFMYLGKKINISGAGAGDIAANNDHVMLIMSNDGSNVIVAEAKGTNYGIVFSSYSYNAMRSYTIVDMDEYYSQKCQ